MSDDEAMVWLRAVGRRVRLARRTRELTQQELADAAGISRSFVSAIEKGQAGGCDVLRLWRVADALGVQLLDLLDAAPGRPVRVAEARS